MITALLLNGGCHFIYWMVNSEIDEREKCKDNFNCLERKWREGEEVMPVATLTGTEILSFRAAESERINVYK